MPVITGALWNALIRTHHITSRKKVAKLRQAADSYAVYVVLRSGSSPGIMYVEGSETGVRDWVYAVQKLRYKDYQLASRPALVERENSTPADLKTSGTHEIESVKDFGVHMQQRGVFGLWRKGMGYAS